LCKKDELLCGKQTKLLFKTIAVNKILEGIINKKNIPKTPTTNIIMSETFSPSGSFRYKYSRCWLIQSV